MVLTLENKKARNTTYGFKHTIRATFASRAMRWTGFLVLTFILYHLAHFTFGKAQVATFKENLAPYTMQSDYRVAGLPAVEAGTQVLDVPINSRPRRWSVTPCRKAGTTSVSVAGVFMVRATNSSPNARRNCSDARMSLSGPANSTWMVANHL